MGEKGKKDQIFQSSHMLVLISYTVLAAALIIESVLMSWELWALPLIAASVIVSWAMHITEMATDRQRLWAYTFLMMGSFVFYGIHLTSMYDMALLMMIVIIIFTTTGDHILINVCLVTYYITMFYDIGCMVHQGVVWDLLMISRTILHIMLMYMAGWLARVIIRQWGALFKDAEKQIDDLNKATNRMNRFLANLSHELRTPINAIMGLSVLLNENKAEGLNDGSQASLEEIIKAGKRIEQQTTDILDLSELETGNLVVNCEHYQMASLLSDLILKIRHLIPDNLEIIIDVDTEIPSVLETDTGKLKKILYHLISNSLKYTKEGGVYVRIHALPQSYGINLCIEVNDTGIGMSKEEQESIFNRFYQSEVAGTVRTGGLGIGLTIVSGFVRALGGFVTVESELDAGTSVHVSLPQKVVNKDACMAISVPEKVNVAGYLNFDKFRNSDIREYYNTLLLHLVQGLKINMHRIHNTEDLKKLDRQIRLTHLFIGEEEYAADPEYIESLTKRVTVVLVAKSQYVLPDDSGMLLLNKPFYCFPAVRIINEDQRLLNWPSGRMICPAIRVLVVDDEPMNLSVARGIFARYEMIVTTASSGQEAISLCESNVYDLIFMDHMMPDMDGVETLRILRHSKIVQDGNCPVIVLTANTLSRAREMFEAEGFDGFLSKPIEKPELERILKRVLPEDAITYRLQGDGNWEDPVLENVSETIQSDRDTLLEEAGIHTRTGRHYCQDDEDFYWSLLIQFAGEISEKQEKLDNYLKAGDWGNYAIEVHALKSSAKMIGAEELSKEAKYLEEAAKAGERNFMINHHEQMTLLYRSITEAITSACEGDRSPLPRPGDVFECSEDENVLEFLPQEE